VSRSRGSASRRVPGRCRVWSSAGIGVTTRRTSWRGWRRASDLGEASDFARREGRKGRGRLLPRAGMVCLVAEPARLVEDCVREGEPRTLRSAGVYGSERTDPESAPRVTAAPPLTRLPLLAIRGCIRPMTVLMCGQRDSDHAPVEVVRLPRLAGARARGSELCARPPALGLRRTLSNA